MAVNNTDGVNIFRNQVIDECIQTLRYKYIKQDKFNTVGWPDVRFTLENLKIEDEVKVK